MVRNENSVALWTVQYSWLRAGVDGQQGWRLNGELSVIARSAEDALACVKRVKPEAEVHSLQRRSSRELYLDENLNVEELPRV